MYVRLVTKKVPGRIAYQYVLLVKDTNGNVSLSSSIDFVLTVGDDEDVYLAYECKRLNVPYPCLSQRNSSGRRSRLLSQHAEQRRPDVDRTRILGRSFDQ